MRAPDLTQWREVWIDDVIDDEDVEVMHIEPLDDLVGHDHSLACICGPYVEYLGKGDWMAAHHPLDKRP